MSPTLRIPLSPFLELIGERTGLRVRDKDKVALAGAIEARMKACRCASPHEYLALLITQSLTTPQSEWKALFPSLLNGESYFLRDRGQIALLKERLLPELIALRSSQRTLRLWSAGCSTGEEPYTLAILVDELLSERAGWNIQILGTDLNSDSLAKARQALYGDWALRGLDARQRDYYFEREGRDWRLGDRWRSMVSFQRCNLRDDSYPNPAGELRDMDLILCRNVLIYFAPSAIQHALDGFSRTLRPGGYLLTGHAELAQVNPAPFVAQAFPESLAYQIPESPLAPEIAPRTIAAAVPPAVRATTKPRPSINKARPMKAPQLRLPLKAPFKAPLAPPVSVPAVPVTPVAQNSWSERARQAANAGRHEEAIQLCREAVASNVTNDEAYFLWAQVLLEQGRSEEARELLKKVLFLVPSHAGAALELAALYESEGDMARAQRLRENALQTLRTLPDDVKAFAGSDIEAGELVRQMEARMGKGGPGQGESASSSVDPSTQGIFHRSRR